jgi:hypothetical protein
MSKPLYTSIECTVEFEYYTTPFRAQTQMEPEEPAELVIESLSIDGVAMPDFNDDTEFTDHIYSILSAKLEVEAEAALEAQAEAEAERRAEDRLQYT